VRSTARSRPSSSSSASSETPRWRSVPWLGEWLARPSARSTSRVRSLGFRADDPAFAGVQRRIQRGTLKRLERAYKAFFRRVKAGRRADAGFPKFKGRDHFDSFGFDGWEQIRFDGKRLHFAGVPGGLKVWVDRPLPKVPGEDTGQYATSIKNVWFKAEGKCGERIVRWYVGFQVEIESKPRHGNGRAVGADWGTSALLTLSTGESVSNPRFAKGAAGAIAQAQRRLARRRKGSRGRLKARLQLQRLHRKVANRRRNYLDKTAKRLVNHFHLVAIDKVSAKPMLEIPQQPDVPALVQVRRNRATMDTAPFLLRQMCLYKAQRDGGQLVEVNPRHDSCPSCGQPCPRQLADAMINCRWCGLSMPRKLANAKENLKKATDLLLSDRGGPVPGGAAKAANAGAGPRRLGKTAAGSPEAGRRSATELPAHTHGPGPRPRPNPIDPADTS
jgi:putative transposase